MEKIKKRFERVLSSNSSSNNGEMEVVTVELLSWD